MVPCYGQSSTSVAWPHEPQGIQPLTARTIVMNKFDRLNPLIRMELGIEIVQDKRTKDRRGVCIRKVDAAKDDLNASWIDRIFFRDHSDTTND